MARDELVATASSAADNQATAAALSQAVKTPEETTAKLVTERDSNLTMVLLGQVAYVLDEVATDFVYRSDVRPHSCSIGTLHSLAADNDLTPEQMLSWQQFKLYINGWAVAYLVGKANELRTQRLPLAHGTQEQQEAVTPSMVDEWAKKNYGPNDSMHGLIKLISKFTLPEKPLCKNPCREIIENEIQESTVE